MAAIAEQSRLEDAWVWACLAAGGCGTLL